MRTVKEISKLTGISVRALHYYDEIGLLKPTAKSEAGYRLYDDKALEALQQVLFFREFDISLKEIKAILDNPELDKEKILKMQRKMLVAKKERLERLIASIDTVLKGENEMNFEVFDKTEIEEMYDSMSANMNEEQKELFIRKYGSMEEWKKHFMETAAGKDAQENFRQIIEWYGSKEAAVAASKNPHDPELMPKLQKQLTSVSERLLERREFDVHSEETMSLMEEYDSISRQLYRMPDVTKMMLNLAKSYQTNVDVQRFTDSVYGDGATLFLGKAIEAFYKRKA